MSQRIKICRVDQLPPGKAVDKRILARRVAVFNDGGSLYGIEADCKHMKASLTTGQVSNGTVTCNWHHWKYDLKTGECIGRPGMKLRTYPVEIADGDIFVLI